MDIAGIVENLCLAYELLVSVLPNILNTNAYMSLVQFFGNTTV